MRVSETRSSKEKDRVTASSTDTGTFHEPNIFLHGSGAAFLNRRTKIGRNTASEAKEFGECMFQQKDTTAARVKSDVAESTVDKRERITHRRARRELRPESIGKLKQ